MAKELRLYEAETAIFDNDRVEEIPGSLTDKQLYVTSMYVYIPDVDLFVRIGMLVDDYAAVTVLYRSENTENYITYENDDIVLTIYNFLERQKTYEEVENMRCILLPAA